MVYVLMSVSRIELFIDKNYLVDYTPFNTTILPFFLRTVLPFSILFSFIFLIYRFIIGRNIITNIEMIVKELNINNIVLLQLLIKHKTIVVMSDMINMINDMIALVIKHSIYTMNNLRNHGSIFQFYFYFKIVIYNSFQYNGRIFENKIRLYSFNETLSNK